MIKKASIKRAINDVLSGGERETKRFFKSHQDEFLLLLHLNPNLVYDLAYVAAQKATSRIENLKPIFMAALSLTQVKDAPVSDLPEKLNNLHAVVDSVKKFDNFSSGKQAIGPIWNAIGAVGDSLRKAMGMSKGNIRSNNESLFLLPTKEKAKEEINPILGQIAYEWRRLFRELELLGGLIDTFNSKREYIANKATRVLVQNISKTTEQIAQWVSNDSSNIMANADEVLTYTEAFRALISSTAQKTKASKKAVIGGGNIPPAQKIPAGNTLELYPVKPFVRPLVEAAPAPYRLDATGTGEMIIRVGDPPTTFIVKFAEIPSGGASGAVVDTRNRPRLKLFTLSGIDEVVLTWQSTTLIGSNKLFVRTPQTTVPPYESPHDNLDTEAVAISAPFDEWIPYLVQGDPTDPTCEDFIARMPLANFVDYINSMSGVSGVIAVSPDAGSLYLFGDVNSGFIEVLEHCVFDIQSWEIASKISDGSMLMDISISKMVCDTGSWSASAPISPFVFKHIKRTQQYDPAIPGTISRIRPNEYKAYYSHEIGSINVVEMPTATAVWYKPDFIPLPGTKPHPGNPTVGPSAFETRSTSSSVLGQFSRYGDLSYYPYIDAQTILDVILTTKALDGETDITEMVEGTIARTEKTGELIWLYESEDVDPPEIPALTFSLADEEAIDNWVNTVPLGVALETSLGKVYIYDIDYGAKTITGNFYGECSSFPFLDMGQVSGKLVIEKLQLKPLATDETAIIDISGDAALLDSLGIEAKTYRYAANRFVLAGRTHGGTKKKIVADPQALGIKLNMVVSLLNPPVTFEIESFKEPETPYDIPDIEPPGDNVYNELSGPALSADDLPPYPLPFSGGFVFGSDDSEFAPLKGMKAYRYTPSMFIKARPGIPRTNAVGKDISGQAYQKVPPSTMDTDPAIYTDPIELGKIDQEPFMEIPTDIFEFGTDIFDPSKFVEVLEGLIDMAELLAGSDSDFFADIGELLGTEDLFDFEGTLAAFNLSGDIEALLGSFVINTQEGVSSITEFIEKLTDLGYDRAAQALQIGDIESFFEMNEITARTFGAIQALISATATMVKNTEMIKEATEVTSGAEAAFNVQIGFEGKIKSGKDFGGGFET